MFIKRVSPFTGRVNTMEIPCTPDQLAQWREGDYVQVAMPQLTNEQREFIVTGVTPEEWREYIG